MDVLDTILQVAPDATRASSLNIPDSAVITAELVPSNPVAVPAVVPPALPEKHLAELDEDITFARQQMKTLMDDTRSAINGAMELATAGTEARPYEVVGGLINAGVAVMKELANLHKVRKETLKTDKEAQQVQQTTGATVVNIDKAVFAGRASDLLRELRQVQQQDLTADADAVKVVDAEAT